MKDETYCQAIALAGRMLREHIGDLRATAGRKRAVNFARELARLAFREAGVDLVDECSVHEDSGEINLTGEYRDG